jgi:hypothetical protein
MSDVREEIWYRVEQQIEEQIDSHMRIRKQVEDRATNRVRDLLWQPGEDRSYVGPGQLVWDQADEEAP